MNEISNTAINEMSAKYLEALAVHEKIFSSARLAATSLVEMAKALKVMRDEKLYTALGFETFGDYVENNNDYSFKERQAYTYIKAYEELGERFLQSNAELGITKLELLAKLPGYERQEFADENNLAGLSVKEIEELIKAKQDLGEQISLLEDEVERTKDNADNALKDAEKYKNRISQLEKQIKDLESKPIEVTEVSNEQTEKAVKEAVIEAEKKYAFEIEELKTALEKEKQNTLKENQKRKEAEKKLSSGSPDEVKIALKMYFEETQKSLTSFVEKFKDIKDKPTKDKFLTGTKTWLRGVLDFLEKEV